MAQHFSPRIVTEGMILCLDAGNRESYPGSGTSWTDLSLNNYSGVLTNSPTYSQNNGGVFSFNGTNNYVDSIGAVGSFSFIQNTGIYTITCWVKLSSLGTETYVLGNNGGSSASKGFFFGKTASNSISLYITRGVSGSSTLGHEVASYFTDTTSWVHMACVGNGVNNQFYKNGVAFSAPASFGTLSTGDSSYLLNAGKIGGYSVSYYWPGSIAKIVVYNRALSGTEVSQNFNATRGRYGV